MSYKNKILIGAAAVLAVAGGGVAIAASDGPRSEDSQAVLDDAAKQLGISPSKLSDALKTALGNRIDEAVDAGRLTKEQGDALKERIQSDRFPLFGGFHRGFGGHLRDLNAAADYLGLTEAQLRSELSGGKSLAQVAQDQGKSVDGLVDALVAQAKEHLDEAVSAGRLTRAQADVLLAGLRDRIEHRVNSTRQPRFHRFR